MGAKRSKRFFFYIYFLFALNFREVPCDGHNRNVIAHFKDLSGKPHVLMWSSYLYGLFTALRLRKCPSVCTTFKAHIHIFHFKLSLSAQTQIPTYMFTKSRVAWLHDKNTLTPPPKKEKKINKGERKKKQKNGLKERKRK